MRLSLKFQQSAPRARTTEFQEASLKKLVCLVLLDSIARFVHVTCVGGRGLGRADMIYVQCCPPPPNNTVYVPYPNEFGLVR